MKNRPEQGKAAWVVSDNFEGEFEMTIRVNTGRIDEPDLPSVCADAPAFTDGDLPRKIAPDVVEVLVPRCHEHHKSCAWSMGHGSQRVIRRSGRRVDIPSQNPQ